MKALAGTSAPETTRCWALPETANGLNPWVKVLDKERQSTNNEDLYLAYILAMDSRKLYLAIVYGAAGVGVRSLSEKAAEYRKNYDRKLSNQSSGGLLANASLVAGIVCYREYTETEMPEDTVLAAEFGRFSKNV